VPEIELQLGLVEGALLRRGRGRSLHGGRRLCGQAAAQPATHKTNKDFRNENGMMISMVAGRASQHRADSPRDEFLVPATLGGGPLAGSHLQQKVEDFSPTS